MERPDPLKLIKKLSTEQKEIVGTNILSPVSAGGTIRVKIQGLIKDYKLDDPSVCGWCIFKIVSDKEVSKVQDASARERSQYLELFPKLDVVLLDAENDKWWALAAQTSDTRFEINHAVPIELVDRGGAFDTVTVRFDGSAFWFDCANRKRDPKVASELRKALNNDVFPDELKVAKSVPQERLAYSMMFFRKHPDLLSAPASDEQANSAQGDIQPTYTWDYQRYAGMDSQRKQTSKIKKALAHAGATLESFWFGDDDSVTVKFSMGGYTHASVVNRNDLTVVSAGICLSGLDREFDLSSLVSVLREFNKKDR